MNILFLILGLVTSNSTYELVAIGSLSTPIQKNWSKEATIKVNFTW